MALNSSKKLRELIIYQVFLRQHTKSGNFLELINDLPRIKDLGVDYIYLLPIFEIGLKNRKGSLGSPYAIKDYYKINPDLGTLEDFKLLIEKCHELGLKVMIDMVLNHTSRDSFLLNKNKNYFYLDKDNNPVNKVGDWSDVCDINYNNQEVYDYLIEMLDYWSNFVDGYRVDTASLVPLKFWLDARKKINFKKRDFLWLAESIDFWFIRILREHNHIGLSDSELFQAFDISYDYDIFHYFRNYYSKKNKIDLKKYLNSLKDQNYVYPDNYTKLHFLENHDNDRVKKHFDLDILLNIYMMNYCSKGSMFIYAGQEFLEEKTPNLFEKDLINFDKKKDISNIFKKMIQIHKNEVITNGVMDVLEDDKLVIFRYTYKDKCLLGYFDVYDTLDKEVDSFIKDDKYINLYNDEEVNIKNNKIKVGKNPIVLEVKYEDTIR